MKKILVSVLVLILLVSSVFAVDLSEFPGMFIQEKKADVVVIIGKAAKADWLDLQHRQDPDGPDGQKGPAQDRANPQPIPLSSSRNPFAGPQRRTDAHRQAGLQRSPDPHDAVPAGQ